MGSPGVVTKGGIRVLVLIMKPWVAIRVVPGRLNQVPTLPDVTCFAVACKSNSRYIDTCVQDSIYGLFVWKRLAA